MLEVALAGQYVIKPSNGWYQRFDKETGEVLGGKYREKETLTSDFWHPILNDTDFKEFVKNQYSIGHVALVSMDDIVEDADG